jgi:hypothetical protein
MITSLFSQSKPVNFISVAVVVVLTAGFANYSTFNFDVLAIGAYLLKSLIALFFVFMLDFIIVKNNLTKKNSYAIMVLGLTFIVFYETLQDYNILVANLLVLFSLRRLMSLHTKQKVKQKIFDMTFWIGLAVLFYAWAILFLVVVVVALAYYWQNDIRNVAVAFLGLLAVFVLLLCYNIIWHDAYILESNFNFILNINLSTYHNASKITMLSIILALYLWSSLFYIKHVLGKNKKMKTIHLLVLLTSLIAVVIAVIAPQKKGHEFLFIIAPFAIIVANYIETIESVWFREIFVSLLLVTPIVALIL